MRALAVTLFLAATLGACETETIELRTAHPDAAPDALVEIDATPPRCVCLHDCFDSRDCLDIGDEVCAPGQNVCEETEPLVDCETSATCTGGRTCVREDDPSTSCD